jgi:hypothetical protein
MTWARQPNTTSGSIWPVTWRMQTAAGLRALRMQPSGADTVSGSSEPALLGMLLATMQPRPNTV